jgi:hypothetical protein
MKHAMRVLAYPPLLLALVWIGTVFALLIVPFQFHEYPSATTWAIIASGVLLYWVSAIFGTALPSRAPTTIDVASVEWIIRWSGAIGLAGIVLLTVDKIFFSGLDYSQGITAVRYLRDEQVVEGIEITRSPLLYVGLLTFSFAYVATTLFLLYAESIRRVPALVGQVAVISPILYALIYGGRAPILLLFSLFVATSMLRKARGLPIIPKVYALRLKLVLFAIAFIAYTNITFESRRELAGRDDYELWLQHLDQTWQVSPRPWLDVLVRDGYISQETALNYISTLYYLLHGSVKLDIIVANREVFAPYWGTFQIGVISPILRVFFPDNTILDRMWADLKDTDLFGYFVTTWGALYLDFGLWGAIIAIIIWGAMSGYAYRNYLRTKDPAASIMLIFWLGSIMMTPVNSPIGMANSLFILVSFIAAAFVMRYRSRRKADQHNLVPAGLGVAAE